MLSFLPVAASKGISLKEFIIVTDHWLSAAITTVALPQSFYVSTPG